MASNGIGISAGLFLVVAFTFIRTHSDEDHDFMDDVEISESDESSQDDEKVFEDTRVSVRLKKSAFLFSYWQNGFMGFSGDRVTIYRHQDSNEDIILSTRLEGVTVKQHGAEHLMTLKVKTRKLAFCIQSTKNSQLYRWIQDIAAGKLLVGQRQKVSKMQKE